MTVGGAVSGTLTSMRPSIAIVVLVTPAAVGKCHSESAIYGYEVGIW